MKRRTFHNSSRPPSRLGLLFGLTLAALMTAQPVPAADKPEASTPLPVRDVVLFSSGVGYYQHGGEINGSADLDFSFRTEQVNDLLKSLVLLDPSGDVKPVTYTASDPVSRGLGNLGISIDSATSMAGILRQLQGTGVKVTSSSGDVEGKILSVSTQQVPGKDVVVNVDILNMLTEGGLVSIPLSDIKQIHLLDATLERKFQEALGLIASGLDRQRKTVTVHFGGKGRREVKMGYLLEAPVWKTSYRLVLDDKKAPYLQGWAIVENMTDEDWNGVNLSLVSGRPVSFIQDLYTPLYVPRPVVQPQVIGSPTPQLHEGSLDSAKDTLALQSQADALTAAPVNAPAPEAPQGFAAFGGAMAKTRDLAMGRRSDLRAEMDQLASSVASQAQGEERGELFEYAIAQPVTLPSRQAAMVPIVSNSIEGKKVSIFNPQVNAIYPMNAVKMKNTSGLSLAGGPITVFSDGIYAGDGQIENLQPDEERLISYALDLAVEGKDETKGLPEQQFSMTIDSGVMHITRKLQMEHDYTLKNKDDKPRTVLIELPRDPSWNVVKPARPDEETPSLYRFQVEVPAKTTGTFQVALEQPQSESYALMDADINFLSGWVGNGQLSEKMRASLKDLVAKRRKITDLQAQEKAAQDEIDAIGQEQARIRENMKTLDHQNALYQEYVKKLTDQESKIDDLRAKIQRLKEAENAAREELRTFVDHLNIG